MARFRGAGDIERLAVDFTTVTATGAVISAPCLLYSVYATLNATSATGKLSFADTTAAADVPLESTRWDLKFGSSAASANSEFHNLRYFNTIGEGAPVSIQRQLFYALATGIDSFSCTYLAVL